MEQRLPKAGDKVNVIEKRNYESGKLTTGVVLRLLSSAHEVHPRGSKVELEDGTVGRLVSFVDEVGVQTQTDPEQREIKAQEVRQNRPSTGSIKLTTGPVRTGPPPQRSIQSNDRDRNSSRPNQPSQNSPAPVPERVVKNSDLPGEDDLR